MIEITWNNQSTNSPTSQKNATEKTNYDRNRGIEPAKMGIECQTNWPMLGFPGSFGHTFQKPCIASAATTLSCSSRICVVHYLLGNSPDNRKPLICDFHLRILGSATVGTQKWCWWSTQAIENTWDVPAPGYNLWHPFWSMFARRMNRFFSTLWRPYLIPNPVFHHHVPSFKPCRRVHLFG